MKDELTPYLVDPQGGNHAISEGIVTLGRAVENTIVIASKKASRLHARIFRDGRKVFLEDQGSTNGTLVNDIRVLGVVELRDGDRVTIGEISLVFHDPDTTTADSGVFDLVVDISAGEVRLNRRPVTLSPKEFALLAHLYDRRGQVCSKEEIGQVVWPEYEHGGVFEYQIENLVRRLRTRIEPDPDHPRLLVTMRGLGYKLV